MKYILSAFFLASIPYVASADTIISLVNRGTGFVGNVLINFLLAVALISFVFNVTRYFIIGGANEQDRERAKRLSIYSIMAFVLIIVMWGIINMLVNGLGFDQKKSLEPDFQKGYTTSASSAGGVPSDCSNGGPC